MLHVLRSVLICIVLYYPLFATTSDQRKLTCISTGLWAPFNLEGAKGELIGIGFDYWHLIAQRAGLEYECKKAQNWNEVLTSIRERRADLTIASQPTSDRLKYAVFSKPYAKYPLVIATKNSVGFIHDIKLIADKKIVMPKGYATTDIIRKKYPDLPLLYTDSIDKALEMVESGKAFATIDIFPVIAYKINKKRFGMLKISGSIPAFFTVGIMLRKDYADLIPLINSAIDTITPEEKARINAKWIKLYQTEKIPAYLFYLLMAGSVLVAAILGIWLWILRRRIERNKEDQRLLQSLLDRDALTGSYSRYMLNRSLDEAIEKAVKERKPFSIIFFDLDNFKQINDLYGHDRGDMILKELCAFIQSMIEPSDIFGRWGGDEFMIIIKGTEEDAIKQAAWLEQRISVQLFAGGIHLTCSFGVTQWQKGDTEASMIHRVDKLLYLSKKEKKKIEAVPSLDR